MRIRKIIFLLSLVANFLLISCGKKNDELIVGKWKIEDVTTPKPNFDNLPDSLVQYYTKQLEIQNTLILSTGYYEFLKKDKCFFTLDGQKYEGKWRLSDDLQKLYTKEKGSSTEEEFTIKELTESVFTIESTVGGKLRRMVMKKEVKP